MPPLPNNPQETVFHFSDLQDLDNPNKVQEIEHEIPEHVLDFGLDSLIPQPEKGTAKISAGKIRGRTIIRKLMSGTDKENPIYGNLLHLFGRREEGASDIAHAIGLKHYPKIKVKQEAHNDDYRKKQSLIEGSHVEGKNLIDYPDFVQNLKETGNNASEALIRTLKKLNPFSIHAASIFNWLIDHRDPHLGNFIITPEKHIVPIDYGLSGDKVNDEKDIPERPCPITTELWRKYPNAVIPKKLLSRINIASPRILQIVQRKILPHYPEEQREKVLNSYKGRLSRIQHLLTTRRRQHITVKDLYPEEYTKRIDGFFGKTQV